MHLNTKVCDMRSEQDVEIPAVGRKLATSGVKNRNNCTGRREKQRTKDITDTGINQRDPSGPNDAKKSSMAIE